MQHRVQFCKAHINIERALFHSMMNVIHVDKKWFYLTRNTQKYYLLNGEQEPHRTTKSKRFVQKVMFLTAVARPQWDHSRNQRFDGKLGIWPFVKQEPAKNNSRNRPAGTLVTKNIDSINSEIYRKFLTQKVLRLIAEKFSRYGANSGIKV